MTNTDNTSIIQNAIAVVTQMMVAAAITAPKAKGENYLDCKVLLGEDAKELGRQMEAYGKEHGNKGFERDGRNTQNSDAVVLFGLNESRSAGLNCGACGYDTCAEMEDVAKNEGQFAGPFCVMRTLDLGIALGSAVKTASLFNVDNRIMYRIGAIARRVHLVDWEFAIGVPLSVTGKSIYFDR